MRMLLRAILVLGVRRSAQDTPRDDRGQENCRRADLCFPAQFCEQAVFVFDQAIHNFAVPFCSRSEAFPGLNFVFLFFYFSPPSSGGENSLCQTTLHALRIRASFKQDLISARVKSNYVTPPSPANQQIEFLGSQHELPLSNMRNAFLQPAEVAITGFDGPVVGPGSVF